VLVQVLNDYDLATKDFYRWEVSYSDEELAEILHERSGIDFGKVTALEPLSRGTSGRIDRLRIVGTKRTIIVGKELEIRRWLSRSHLYSSAFVAERTEGGFTLHGAGWGHGVGLCQIGAAVMGARGYNYKQILKHYFRNAEIERLY
jgi:SpoIID/LytB domain protein